MRKGSCSSKKTHVIVVWIIEMCFKLLWVKSIRLANDINILFHLIPISKLFKETHFNTIYESVLNNFPNFHGDWINGIVMHKKQTYIRFYLYRISEERKSMQTRFDSIQFIYQKSFRECIQQLS